MMILSQFINKNQQTCRHIGNLDLAIDKILKILSIFRAKRQIIFHYF
ncbi:unnamed protein product [Paramecium octaurelia]|uniref:Uncharacterized protein n=1 Tax=Paramecium octaurelia TaxID=43137 RepID=A0A8S1VLN6_PAROT|nr:unnamed protein product [Paramecium octaurelia]